MCFLYRQSISIVYESKFKYIYRYFIKIDRCFCGILQSLPLRKCGLKLLHIYIILNSNLSLPLRKCGLKSDELARIELLEKVTSLAEVWIEINTKQTRMRGDGSLPLRKCGLKFFTRRILVVERMSLPLRKCGLKSRIWQIRSVMS